MRGGYAGLWVAKKKNTEKNVSFSVLGRMGRGEEKSECYPSGFFGQFTRRLSWKFDIFVSIFDLIQDGFKSSLAWPSWTFAVWFTCCSFTKGVERKGKRLKIVRLNLETERKENIVGRARKRVEKKCLSVRATAAMRVLAEALNSSGEIRALKLYKSIFVDNLPFLKFCSVLWIRISN